MKSDEEYLHDLNPSDKVLLDSDRPTLHVGDLDGMADGARTIGRQGSIVMKRDGDSFYALDGGQVVGFVSPLSDTEIDLSVVAEYQRQGIGTALLAEFRKVHPKFLSGGYTEGGRKTELKVKRMLESRGGKNKPSGMSGVR